MLRAALVAGSLIFLAGCAGADSATPDQIRLTNGLTVSLRPVKGATDVAIVVLFNVGEQHDPEGRSGLAHLVEHCYVTAAAGRSPPRDAASYVRRYPKGWNAQTGEDYTVVACVFPAESLEEELRDAAARMGDLRITTTDLDREKPRLIAELHNMYCAIPTLAARNLARSRARPDPRGGRKGGLAEHVAAITLEQVRSHWQRFYKPRNATLVLAGGFDPALARDLLARLFASLPPGEAAAPAPPRPHAPGAPAARLETVRTKSAHPTASTVACLAYATPEPGNDLYAAVLMLASRLASACGASQAQPGEFPVVYAALDDPGVITIADRVAANETPQAAIARLEAMVAEAVRPDVSAADIAATKNQFGFLLGLVDVPDGVLAQNLYGVAFGIGRRAQMRIDPAVLRKAIEGVAPADLRRAADTVFGGDRAAVVVIPEP